MIAPEIRGASFHRGASKQDYATPPEFIDAVVRRFGPLSFDLAASPENAKSDRFFTEADDSLKQDWAAYSGNLWLNPPFGNIAPWASKCRVQQSYRSSGRILFLVPASVGAVWFAEHVHGHALVLALVGRLCFDGKAPFPKDCMLCVYGEAPGFAVWRWR